MKRTISQVLGEHQSLDHLSTEQLERVAGCGRNVSFSTDEMIFREGEPAERFWLLRGGRVALEIHAPGREPILVDTLDEGEVLGWSWLFPPYKWHFDARAVTSVRATELDGRCLREKCDEDPVLGYAVVMRFAQIAIGRLQAARLQVLDLYGEKGSP